MEGTVSLATVVYLALFVVALVEFGESRSRLALVVMALLGFLLLVSVGVVHA